MISKHDIIQNAKDMVGARHDTSADASLSRLLNQILVSESEGHSWHKLRRVMEVDLSESSSDLGEEGVWLPGNLAGVDAVQDSSTGEFFTRRDTSAYDMGERGMKRYSVHTPSQTPLFWSDDCMVMKGADTFTCPTLGSENYTGEWVRFGSEPGVYQLTAAATFTPKYWGDDQAQGSIVVRPESTRKLSVHDGERLKTSGKVKVYYWEYHHPMYRDSDMLLFPNPRYVVLLMMRESVGTLSRRDRNALNNELDFHRKESLRLNPHFQVPSHPRDRIGNTFNPADVQHVSRRDGRPSAQGIRVTYTEPTL